MDLLRELAPKHTTKTLMRVFTSRSAESIRSKAVAMGLSIAEYEDHLRPKIDHAVVEILRASAQ